MIVISDCSKDIVIPAGLGDNAGVIYDVAGVKSLNGQTGDVTLKTVNGNELTGDGNIEIKAGVESVNGKTGAVVIPALQYFVVSQETKKAAYDEIANHWDDNSGYTGDYIFCYKKDNGGFYTFTEIGYLKGHSVYFSWLNNEGAYSIGDGKVKCFSIIIWYNAGDPSLDTYQQDCTIPTKVSELTNDSEFQTKAEVDTAIENAVSGGGSAGSDNVIVLDNLSQEEVKAVYDKLDKTKVPNLIFSYENSFSFRTYWNGDSLHFNTLHEEYSGLVAKDIELRNDGSIGNQEAIFKYTNTLTLNVGVHVDEGADFECGYSGSYYEYMVRPYNRPNSHIINLEKGIGDITTPIYVPVSVYLGNENYNSTTPVRIQFIANGKLYTYLNDSNQENKWLFESAKPITGGGGSTGSTGSDIINLDSLTQEEKKGLYDKFEVGKNPDVIFLHGDSSSFRAFWQDGNIAFDTFLMAYKGLRIRRYEIEHDGNVYEYEEPFTWNNLLLLSVEQHTAEGADFECGYSGDFFEYMGRNSIRPNSYFILFNNGIGDSTKPVFVPVSVIWDNNNFDGNIPIRIQFTANDKLYTYLHGDTDGKWLFESAKPIGGVQSSEVSNIKVLTQSQYDALTAKDENVLYCIKG